jgi:hypothetical protein
MGGGSKGYLSREEAIGRYSVIREKIRKELEIEYIRKRINTKVFKRPASEHIDLNFHKEDQDDIESKDYDGSREEENRSMNDNLSLLDEESKISGYDSNDLMDEMIGTDEGNGEMESLKMSEDEEKAVAVDGDMRCFDMDDDLFNRDSECLKKYMDSPRMKRFKFLYEGRETDRAEEK